MNVRCVRKSDVKEPRISHACISSERNCHCQTTYLPEELTQVVVMATRWILITTRVAVICTLSTLSLALPTDRDASAVDLAAGNSGQPLLGHPVAPAVGFQQAGSSNPNILTSDLGQSTDTGSNKMPGSFSRPGGNFSPSSPGAVRPGSSGGSVGSTPFTNHFILDTANLDLDGDGCIAGEVELDLFKYHVATALMGSPNNLLRAHSIVHRTDTNKDGRICWCDFISIYLHDKDEANDKHHAAPFVVILDKNSGMFARLDTDGNGMLKGEELDNLMYQFSSCIPEEQARLIVAAMTGLEVKDGAISADEFARFLGMDSNNTASQSGAETKNPGTTCLSSADGVAQLPPGAQSGISGVLLTSTAIPPIPNNATTDNRKESTDNQ
ncbi:hypothetical protein PoB_001470900 [Plakobranchus ocellatus]|uniref:EF-hand domain-containing protein n=1 Tax=Plakobranchus ocellatus TaxID=259542 RepID=A0AAV3Z1D0_9GAST|nr:hypothetical protein PoB_001470900 [Plakobranchus ocellatus]